MTRSKLKCVSYTIGIEEANKVAELAEQFKISKSSVISIILNTFFQSLDKYKEALNNGSKENS